MKITKFYIDKARYKAIYDSAHEILVEIDYWNNSYKISNRNKELEKFAETLLRRKHKVNFVNKLLK